LPEDPTVPKKQKPLEPPKVCKHLSGPGYDEYLRLIQTRTLGGVSAEFRAQAVCQLFPFKQLPHLKKEPRKKDINLIFVEIEGTGVNSNKILKIPENGNGHINKWTEVEKHKLDRFLLGWARWEVDYVHGFMRSVCCKGTTTNPDGICDACVMVSHDESLKQSI
jgi:hypothetical protein